MSRPAILFSLLLTACITSADDPACPSCRSERLTLDDHGFYDAGGRWLSRISDPMLGGTVLGNQPVHVFAGTTPLGVAHIKNERWSMHLAPGTITKGGIVVRIEVAEPADDATEDLFQTIALDERDPINYPPPVFDARALGE